MNVIGTLYCSENVLWKKKNIILRLIASSILMLNPKVITIQGKYIFLWIKWEHHQNYGRKDMYEILRCERLIIVIKLMFMKKKCNGWIQNYFYYIPN